MKKTHTSHPRAVLPPEIHPPFIEESDLPQAEMPIDTAPLGAFLFFLFRIVVSKRKADLEDPSHALLQARFRDFEERVYGSDSRGIGIGQAAGTGSGDPGRRAS